MSSWGATDSDESKPKYIIDSEKKEVYADAKGWVRQAGTKASGNDNPNATPDWSLDNFCPCCGEEEPGIIPIDECEGWEGEIYDGIPYQDSLEFCSNMYFYNSNFGCMQVGEAFCNAFDNCPNPNTFPTQESCCNNIQDAIGYTPTSWEEFCG